MQPTSIEWCDLSWNPISGCNNGCPYCYAARMSKRLKGRFGYDKQDPFRPTFHPDKLKDLQRLGTKHKRIFVCSMGDIFSEGVEPDWIAQIIAAVWEKPEHQFLALTKRPERILEMLHCINLPDNLWWGVSVTKQEDLWRIATLKDALPTFHKFVSFEPLHGPISPDYEGIEWAIIGAESGTRNGKIVPDVKWAEQLASAAFIQGIPVFIKDNLLPIYQAADENCVGVAQAFPEDFI